jgi:predicted RNA-binding protein with PUA-like domain
MKYWVAKAKPSDNDFPDMLVPGKRVIWYTKKPPRDWDKGDRLFVWQSSPSRRVVGLGEIETILPGQDKDGYSRFKVKHQTREFGTPITLDQVRESSILAQASFTKSGPSGTLFPLTDYQAKTLLVMALRQNKNIKTIWSDPAHVSTDIAKPPPSVQVTIERIIRDTAVANSLKARYKYRCQICRRSLKLGTNNLYAEGHHIRPLGGKHKGIDEEGNMLVLCPNHHALFDFGVPRFVTTKEVEIHKERFILLQKHSIDERNILYHNKRIYDLRQE